MVCTDRQQTRVLALGACIWLGADSIEAGNLGQPSLEFADELCVTAALLGGYKGVQQAKLRPGDGEHRCCGAEFHGAGTQRDHRGRQRQILCLEPFNVRIISVSVWWELKTECVRKGERR